MKIKSKKLLAITALLSLSVLGFIACTPTESTEDYNILQTQDSLMTGQVKSEKEFKSAGFTLASPDVIINPYGISPLTALVIFETEVEGVPKITVEGKDDLSTIEGEGELDTIHYVPVYGLYANTANKVTIEFNGEVKELTIQTDELYEKVPLAEVVEADLANLENDFYFFTPSSDMLPVAYDVNGDVRWYLTEKMKWEISQLDNGRLLLGTERMINPPYYTTGLYEMDFLGKVYNEYSLPGGYHHDYYELANGNLVVATDDFTDFAFGTVEDLIVELDRETGKIVREWNLKDVLPMDEGKSENWISFDWFHNNSVWVDEEQDELILSGRHQDAVVGLDYSSGELKWIIGDSTNWSDEMQKYFFKPIGEDFEWQWSQHSATVTPEGYIFLLDNGNNKSKIKDNYVPANESYTRGVMYDIDRDNMTIEQIWEHGKERGSDFYSPYVSDVDYIDKDHVLIHSGGIVFEDGEATNQPAGLAEDPDLTTTMVELKDDEVIFELSFNENSYRAEKISIYEGTDKFKLGEPGKLGTLGETLIDNDHDELGEVSEIDDYYESLDISFTLEEDRLNMNGFFKKKGFYELVLVDDDGKIRGYNFVSSDRPYTALCVDVLSKDRSDDAKEVNKNIHKEGLQGKHRIYLRAGETLYDTETIVDFDR